MRTAGTAGAAGNAVLSERVRLGEGTRGLRWMLDDVQTLPGCWTTWTTVDFA